jgi:hypothetical protein
MIAMNPLHKNVCQAHGIDRTVSGLDVDHLGQSIDKNDNRVVVGKGGGTRQLDNQVHGYTGPGMVGNREGLKLAGGETRPGLVDLTGVTPRDKSRYVPTAMRPIIVAVNKVDCLGLIEMPGIGGAVTSLHDAQAHRRGHEDLIAVVPKGAMAHQAVTSSILLQIRICSASGG